MLTNRLVHGEAGGDPAPPGNHPFLLGGVADSNVVMVRPIQPASIASTRAR
jgi:hypothetical protein